MLLGFLSVTNSSKDLLVTWLADAQVAPALQQAALSSVMRLRLAVGSFGLSLSVPYSAFFSQTLCRRTLKE